MSQRCRACGAAVPWLADQCRACGIGRPAPTPWYVYLLGGVLVAALLLWMADLDSLARLLGR
jgi:hypothetical protein